MTKIFLASGGVRKKPDQRRAMFAEAFDGLKKPKVLVSVFAQQREFWYEKFPTYSSWMEEVAPGAEFDLAEPKKFVQQCEWADVIYFHGGDSFLIQCRLQQYDLEEIFRDKIVITNSAASMAMATLSWGADSRELSEGLAILPIKFIPHFESDSYGIDDPRGPVDWAVGLAELKAAGDPGMEVHALREGEYGVFEVDLGRDR